MMESSSSYFSEAARRSKKDGFNDSEPVGKNKHKIPREEKEKAKEKSY